MGANQNERVNESKIMGSEYEEIDPYFSKVSKSICKIFISTQNGTQYGSGVFLKFSIEDLNLFCLITNEHIITESLIEQNATINVFYDNEFENIEIELNKKERYIKTFTDIKIDATVVQILPKDNVYEIYFLSPELENLEMKKLKGKQIYVPQYPSGQKLKNSKGIIKNINNYEFIHLASTENCSSGSPIFLKDSIKIIGIHKQGNKKKNENYADFIFPIFNILKKDINNIKEKIQINNKDDNINELNENKPDEKEILNNKGQNKKNENKNYLSENIGQLLNIIDDLINKIDINNSCEYINELTILRKYCSSGKIRIAFLGDIVTGKSTVLNCIIGENILPVKEFVSTNRIVFIKHNKDLKDFQLFNRKLISKGKGNNKYYDFEDMKKPCCIGKDKIIDYLKNKNEERKIQDEDASFLLVGNLKIFDFIKLEEDKLNFIEFVDLPGFIDLYGTDKRYNLFQEYYKKIKILFNCQIFFTDPENIFKYDNIPKIIYECENYKSQLPPQFRNNFFDTCLFLINKIDLLINEDDKEEFANELYNNLKSMSFENFKPMEGISTKEIMNISFFSGRYFFQEYLHSLNKYSDLINKPNNAFKKLILEYKDEESEYESIEFKEWIIMKLELEKDEFGLDLNEDKDVPREVYNRIHDSLIQSTISKKDEEELIQLIYNTYIQLLNKIPHYAFEFFSKLQKVITNTYNLQMNILITEIKKILDIFDVLVTTKEFSNLKVEYKIQKEKIAEIIKKIK